VIDFVHRWSGETEIAGCTFILWLGLATSKFYRWRVHNGKVNEHNGWVPRDFWLEEWEKRAIVEFHDRYPLEGYRRLTFMMLDQNVVAVSPASVWRVLHAAGRLSRWKPKDSSKEKGFQPPLGPHEHWHVDISYVNLGGTFYYLCGVLDGYSRYLAHWELRESMREAEVEIILERAREKFPAARPRIISDNGPQFIARDFKEFIRICGMTHVRTSPFYPQSNGKIERWHPSLKGECIRPAVPSSVDEARRQLTNYVDHYNRVRLHSHRLRRTARQTGRSRRGDLDSARSETGGGATAAAAPAPADLAENGSGWPRAARTKLKSPGETEAGSAGEQPRRGITRWAHRVDEIGSVRAPGSALPFPTQFRGLIER
jgi:putative transposase